MMPFLDTFFGNPSSLYRAGRVARSAVETAREQIAALTGVQPGQIIFTSGGTEANNLALRGLKSCSGIAVSAIEHPSVLETAQSLQEQGRTVKSLAVDSAGHVVIDCLAKLAHQKIDLVSVMLANNETGLILDVAEISDCCRQQGVIIHTDAVQAAGKIAIDFNRLGVHLLTLSSHKIYGPKGCGALIFDQQLDLNPILTGGEQEQGLRAGTENVAAIVGFGKAAEIARVELEERQQKLSALRQQLEQGLNQLAGVTIFAQDQLRLPNTVQIGLLGVDGEMLQMKLDQQGIAVSSGSACKSGGGKPSHVLMAMGVVTTLAKSAIRISLGQGNSAEEVEQFIGVLKASM